MSAHPEPDPQPQPATPPPFPPRPPAGGSAGGKRLVWLVVAVVAAALAVLVGAVVFAASKLAPQWREVAARFKTPDQLRREREALAKLEQARRETVAAQRRALDDPSGDTVTGSTERVDRARALLDEAARQFRGDDRKAMEIVQARLGELREKSQAYEAVLTELRQAGFFDPKSLPSKAALADRRKLAQRWASANEELAAYLRDLESNLRADLEKSLVAREQAATFASAFARGAHLDQQLQIRDYDHQMAGQALALLDLLETQWGRWQVDGLGTVRFSRPEALTKFNELQRAIHAAGAAQVALQKQLLAAPAPSPSAGAANTRVAPAPAPTPISPPTQRR